MKIFLLFVPILSLAHDVLASASDNVYPLDPAAVHSMEQGLTVEELSTIPQLKEEEAVLAGKEISQFAYCSTGVNPLPTLAFGFRKLYGSHAGSDFSLSASLLPIFSCGKVGVVPLPGINYKQLFFQGTGWKGLAAGGTAFYLGAGIGAYPVGVTAGGLLGWQFRREKRWDFCEVGFNPLFYYGDSKFSVIPLASFTYAFAF